MTLFFDLKEVDKDYAGDPVKTLELFHYLITKKPVRKGWKIPSKNYIGSSFLLNPKPLLGVVKQVDILFIIQYIKAAALRDYTLYKLYGIKYLPLSYYPDINLTSIKHNPLITIKDNNLIFKFE